MLPPAQAVSSADLCNAFWDSSVQSLDQLGSPGKGGGSIKDDSAEILFQFFFLQEAVVSNAAAGQGHPLFDVVHPAFSLPTTASPVLQGDLRDVFGEAVVACDTPELTG